MKPEDKALEPSGLSGVELPEFDAQCNQEIVDWDKGGNSSDISCCYNGFRLDCRERQLLQSLAHNRSLEEKLAAVATSETGQPFETWWEATFGASGNAKQEMVKSIAFHAYTAGEGPHFKWVARQAVKLFEIGVKNNMGVLVNERAEKAEAELTSLRERGKELEEALKVTLDICEDGDTGANFERVVAAMNAAAEALGEEAP